MKTETISTGLPFWLQYAQIRQRPSGAWVVKLRGRTQGIGCRNREEKTVVVSLAYASCAQQALCRAANTPTGNKVRLAARGCHIMVQIKLRFSPEARAEIFHNYAAQMRAKYDGEHYLYESEEGQNELIRTLGLSDIIAASYPVGLTKQLCPN